MTDKVIETNIVNCQMNNEGVPSHVNDYKIIKMLGEGSFGKVYQCHNSKGEEYALKILNKSILKRKKEYKKVDGKMFFSNAFQKVQREVAIMKKLCHKHLVKLYEIIDSPENDKLFLVLEFVHGGQVMYWDEPSFRYCARKYPSGLIPSDVVKNGLGDIILALDYLHANHICHRDIKPENILIANTEEFKLADFGVAQMLEGSKNQLLRSTEGTYHFLAPECATGLEYDPYRVDIWALGVTMYVMLQGTLPFGDGVSSLTQVMESIQKDDFKCSPEIEQECVHLLRRLLEKDPINRITIEELKQYPWLEMKKRTQRVVNNKNKIIEVTQQEIDAAFTPVNNFILMAKLKMKMNSRLYKARKSLGARNNIVILNEKLEDVSTKESDCQGEIQKERPTTMKKKNSRNYDIRSPRNEPIENLASTSQSSAPVCIRRESRSEAIEMPIERSSASEQTSTASSIPLLVKKQSSKKLITGEVHPILIKKTSKSQVGAIEYLTALQAASSLTRKPQHNNEENSCCDDKTSVLINKTSNCKLAGEGKTLAQTASVEAESSERITRTSQGREDCESDLSVDNGEENVNESVSISTTLCSVTSKELQPSVSRSMTDIIAATGEKEVPVIKVEAEIIKGTSPMETSLSKEELVTQQNNISAAGTPLICTTAQDEKVISQSIKSLDSSFSQMTSKNPNIGDEKGQTPPYDNISNNEVHVVKIKSHDREILKIEGTVSLELLLDTTKSSGPVKPPLPKHQNSIMAALDALAHEPSSNESNDPLVKEKSGKKQYETEGITLFGFPLTNSRKKNSFIAPTLDDEHGAPLVDTHGIMMMNLLRCKSSSNDPNQTTSSDTVIPFDNKYAPSGSIKSQDENSVADDRNDKQINQNIVLKSVIVQVKPSNHHFKTNCSIM